jgi:hypothetical protein
MDGSAARAWTLNRAIQAMVWDNAVVLSTVDEIEGLTTGLARKICQKRMTLHAGPKQGKNSLARSFQSADWQSLAIKKGRSADLPLMS